MIGIPSHSLLVFLLSETWRLNCQTDEQNHWHHLSLAAFCFRPNDTPNKQILGIPSPCSSFFCFGLPTHQMNEPLVSQLPLSLQLLFWFAEIGMPNNQMISISSIPSPLHFFPETCTLNNWHLWHPLSFAFFGDLTLNQNE